MVVASAKGGRENGELLFNEHRVSVLHTTVRVSLQMIKIISFRSCVFYHNYNF